MTRSASDRFVELGVAAARARRFGEAEALFRSAAQADPDAALAHENLGKALRAQGRVREAMPHMAAALARDPALPGAARVFALYAMEQPLPESADAARALELAFTLPGVDRNRLAQPALRQWKAVAAEVLELGRRRGWDEAAARALARPRALAHPLLTAVLAESIVCEPEVELLLTAVRRRLALDGAGRPQARRFCELLARQAGNNACAWMETPEERASTDPLVAAMYRRPGPPPPFAGLRLGGAGDDTSRRVAEQYEDSPYPRWNSLTAPRPGELREQLRRLSPERDWSGPLDALIAGCGTGRQAIAAALGYGDARILACDISAASLGWAAARAREYGVAGLELVQSDLREIGRLGRRFDAIECAGVLHHLADPEEGWRRLLDVLAPGGLMLVALYSEAARRAIVAARAEIARQGLGSDPESIRRFRRHVLAVEDDWARQIRRSPDFYDLYGARDMLFHVHERRFSLPEIAAMLDRLGLDCVAVEPPPDAASAYAARHPDDPAMRSLANWAAFEAERPRTFRGMIQFWCARAAGAQLAAKASVANP